MEIQHKNLKVILAKHKIWVGGPKHTRHNHQLGLPCLSLSSPSSAFMEK